MLVGSARMNYQITFFITLFTKLELHNLEIKFQNTKH